MDPTGHLRLLAAAEGPTLDPLSWLQYGVLGLVVVSFLLGWLWPRPSVDELKAVAAQARADRVAVEAQRDLLIKSYEDKVIPVLVDVQRTIMPAAERMAQALDAMREEHGAVANEVMKLNREMSDVLAVIRSRER